MNMNLYLFLPANNKDVIDLDSSVLNWVYEDENKKLKSAQGSAHDAALVASAYYITVVLPGEDVLFLNAEVPGKNIQRVQQAVPYVLEDSVIDDVDDLYFAISKSNKNIESDYDVSVINKKYFENVIEQLEKIGIYADVITADYLLIENNSMISDGKRVIVNSDDAKFSSSIESEEVFTSDGAELKKINCEVDSSLCFIESCSKTSSINLLQGAYKKKKDWSNTGKTWLPIAALFLVWLSVQGGLFIFDYIGLSKQNDILSLEITNIYKKSFPNSRRIIDAKAQMQQKLTELKKRKGQSGRSFTNMLSASASIFSETQGLNIKSLRFYDGQISIEIQIANLQELDKLKVRLQSEKGYKVEIQNASSGKEDVTARLQISGVKS